MPLDTTLLDLDRVPTLDELKANIADAAIGWLEAQIK